MGITLELSAAEALMVLDPIQDKALTASRLAAETEGEIKEIHDLAARICGNVAKRIVDELYPNDLTDIQRADLIDQIEFGLL